MAIEKMQLVDIVGHLPELDQTLLKCIQSGVFHPETVLSSGDKTTAFSLMNGENTYAASLKKLYDLAQDIHAKLLLRNGADYVVYAERESAERLAIKFGAKNIFDYVELTPEYSIYEISVPSSWRGKSIIQTAVRSKYKISILAIKVGNDIFPLPTADHVFSAGETMIVMGHQEDIKALTK